LEFRLTGGRTRFEGRVEVKYRGIWGTVCDDDFGAAETNGNLFVFLTINVSNSLKFTVVCRSLGYNGPSVNTVNIFSSKWKFIF
jgi:HGF/MSP/plasminogen-like protein